MQILGVFERRTLVVSRAPSAAGDGSGNLYGLVVRIDRCWVVRTAGWVERLSGGKEGFDGFVSEDDQRGHRPEAGRERLVAAGVADAANDLFAAEFLQIISGVAGAVL
jgi:hypothetical protein